jgi:hypothetical protein
VKLPSTWINDPIFIEFSSKKFDCGRTKSRVRLFCYE